ncbi:hypothetical protein ACPPVT_13720 [Angustibacter sp. McL0619]|uniref:hypothetical protein n=1 Tax=Angustibacter sp. McL0619 TaxID=3415676 RepID=UPI003CE6AC44
MGLLDRLRERMRGAAEVTAGGVAPTRLKRRRLDGPDSDDNQVALRARLHDDPNDSVAFAQLAEVVRREAAEGHEDEERRPRAVADAEWALAEELAHNSRAWYPLIELGRLSLREDLEGAQRRLGIAVERETTGRALEESLSMLRREGMPEVALALGVGHWRPREHVPGAGRELVQAAAEAGRISEARRHLDALAEHPDADVVDLRDQLDQLAARRPAAR